MRHVAIAVAAALAGCPAERAPEPRRPAPVEPSPHDPVPVASNKPFDEATLERMAFTPLPGWVADVMPGLIEGHANQRYTRPDPEIELVVSFGICDPCAPLDINTEAGRAVIDQLTPETLEGAAKRELFTLEIGGKPVIASHAIGVDPPSALHRVMLYHHNGINYLRIGVGRYTDKSPFTSIEDLERTLPKAMLLQHARAAFEVFAVHYPR